MRIPVLESIMAIERQYNTGENPVLVTCSDMNAYVCKYMRTSMAAYKLVCELIGCHMSAAWQLGTPDAAFIAIKPAHWTVLQVPHVVSAVAIGCKKLDGVVDITPSTYADVADTKSMLIQILKIALFDFWLANEDRNANNANLLYEVKRSRLVPIDHGCILNTATFDSPMSQLTMTDTILYSGLFARIVRRFKPSLFAPILDEIKQDYIACLKRSKVQVDRILEDLPMAWGIDSILVNNKLQQLFDEKWEQDVWDNFIECLNNNTNNE